MDAATSDWGTDPAHIASTASRLLGVVVRAACGPGASQRGQKLHERLGCRLGPAWRRGRPGKARFGSLRRPRTERLHLCGTCCSPSTGASLAACVLTGLSALSGPRHGGMTDRVRALAADPVMRQSPARALGERLAQGEPIPGFGHRLYPEGDPRYRAPRLGLPPAPRPGQRSLAPRPG